MPRDLTPLEKTKGPHLTMEDLVALQNDSNSLFFKALQDMRGALLAFVISEHIVAHILLMLQQIEANILTANAESDARYAKAKEDAYLREIDQSQFKGDKTIASTAGFDLDKLTPAQRTALVGQLSIAQQNIMTQLQNNLLANLTQLVGPSITLPGSSNITLKVPTQFTQPAPSIAKVLEYNLDLQKQVLGATDPNVDMASAFSRVFSIAQTGPLALIRAFREILIENNIDDLEDIKDKFALFGILSKVAALKEENEELAKQFFSNNDLITKLLKKDYKPEFTNDSSLAKNTASMYGTNKTPRPLFGERRTLPEEQNDYSPSKKG